MWLFGSVKSGRKKERERETERDDREFVRKGGGEPTSFAHF